MKTVGITELAYGDGGYEVYEVGRVLVQHTRSPRFCVSKWRVNSLDTLRANLENCVGLAGNMIGVKKRILVFAVGSLIVPMINPVMLNKEKIYETEESCLSLIGFRKTKRYEKIEVEYLDRNFNKQKQVFTGFTAQIIQHEMDHFEGIII